jgi:hypothetical protein
MICRPVAWTLLIVHFFVEEPIREQLLAMESIVCALCTELKPLHIVTFFVLAIYFIQTSYEWLLWSQLIHHIIVAACIIGEYYIEKWHFWSWILLCWCMRWLSSISIYYQHPVRSALRCIVFGFVAQKRFAKTFKDGFKWCWILLVHECALSVLPLQMLYEVYSAKSRATQSPV